MALQYVYMYNSICILENITEQYGMEREEIYSKQNFK